MTYTNYQRGVNYERKTMAIIRKEGYWVYRQAGSHTDFDVIAFRKLFDNVEEEKPSIRAIQVKSGKSPYKKAIEELRDLEIPLFIQKELWVWTKYDRKPNIIIVGNDKSRY